MQKAIANKAKANMQTEAKEASKPMMKKIGNFIMDMDHVLGKGEYGKVYLA